jgi:hypothetical protein
VDGKLELSPRDHNLLVSINRRRVRSMGKGYKILAMETYTKVSFTVESFQGVEYITSTKVEDTKETG